MALAYNPFSKEEIDRRAQEQQARQQQSVFSQLPAGTVPPSGCQRTAAVLADHVAAEPTEYR